MWAVHRLVVTAALLIFCCSAVNAEKRALIVGVSEYPSLQGANLVGPANDAALVRAVLGQRGFDEKYIVELSERPEAQDKPLRKNILAELELLASTSQKGDFIYLHFAGHGSRQPTQAGDSSETDGLDEIFLPADAAKWDKSTGTVVNAITDNEVGTYLDQIRRRGAHVWVVFDSCHSGTMTRGGGFGDVRYRQLAPASLGVPQTSYVKHRGGGGSLRSDTQSFISGGGGEESGTRGYLIAFSAAQSTQTTPEMNLPRNGENRSVHGVFTYNLMTVLSRHSGISYSQLGQQILELYRTLPWRASQPMISGGSDLDKTVFGESSSSMDAWPAAVDRKGETLDISAGRLQNFSVGSLINLYSSPIAQEESFLSQAKVTSAAALSSTAVTISDEKLKLPKKVYTVLKEPALDFALSIVTLPVVGQNNTELLQLEAAVQAAIEKSPLLAAWGDGEIADIRIAVFDNSLWFISPDQSLPCEYQKLQVAELQRCHLERTPQRLLNVAFPTTPKMLEHSINSALNRIARVENLVRMQAYANDGATKDSSPLEVEMTVTRSGIVTKYPLTEVPVFGDGDEVTVVIKNISRKPQDISLLYRDAMYGIAQIWPESGQSNRVQAGDQLAPIVLELYPEPEGLEDFIIMSQPGEGIARDFSFLEQEPLGVASRSAGNSSAFGLRGDEQPSVLQLLFDTVLYENGESTEKLETQTRGARKKSKPNLGGMQVFSWEVRR
ncbi:MAG: caspase family protein [Halioglobus sp.]